MRSLGQVVPIAKLTEERHHLLDVAYWMLGNGPVPENVVNEAYRQWYGLSDHERSRRAGVGAVGDAVTGTSSGHAEHAGIPVSDQAGGARTEQHFRDGAEYGRRYRRSAAARVQAARRPCALLQNRRATPTTPQQHGAVTGAVHGACVAEEAGLLASLLVPDVTVYFDGGGKMRALVRPVHGRRQVARSLLRLLARHRRSTLDTHPVNGRTGLVIRYDRQVAGVIRLDLAGRHVVKVWVTLKPTSSVHGTGPVPLGSAARALGAGRP